MEEIKKDKDCDFQNKIDFKKSKEGNRGILFWVCIFVLAEIFLGVLVLILHLNTNSCDFIMGHCSSATSLSQSIQIFLLIVIVIINPFLLFIYFLSKYANKDDFEINNDKNNQSKINRTTRSLVVIGIIEIIIFPIILSSKGISMPLVIEFIPPAILITIIFFGINIYRQKTIYEKNMKRYSTNLIIFLVDFTLYFLYKITLALI
jgi:hypothetical protein